MKIRKFIAYATLLCSGAALCAEASAQQYRTTDIRDMALIYQGGSHRLDWTVEEFRPYVVHEFADGERDWLFDGFLFLEFKNGSGRNYTVGYEKLNARRGEWEWLLGRIFEQGKSLSALDQCIGEEIARLGKPGFTHRIVLGLPEAIRGQKDWGELDGRTMDFSDEKDQIAATRWYIDQLIERFRAAHYKHLELAGFYWVAEDTNHCEDLTIPLSDYIHSQGYLFYWIPYWQAKGAGEWQRLGFDIAYQQPNHFFNDAIPDSRIDETCRLATQAGMSLEMEFDENALQQNGRGSRMKAYIDSYERNGIFDNNDLAYYQGNNAFSLLRHGTAEDRALYERLASIIARRQKEFILRAGKEYRFVVDFLNGSPQSSCETVRCPLRERERPS